MIDSAVILAVSSTAHDSKLEDKRPRAMLPVLGKPMVVRVMDRLYRAGIRRYQIIVGINEGAVASYLKHQWMPDANVEFVLQTNQSLGLLMARLSQQIDQPFIVASYNSFTFEHHIYSLLKQHADFENYLILTGATSSLSQHANTDRYALVGDDKVQGITAIKPESNYFVLTEHAICGHHFVEHLQGLDDKTAAQYGKTWFEIVQCYIDANEAQVKVAETSWVLRIEGDTDLVTLNKKMLDDSNDGHVLSELPYTVRIVPPVRIDPQVSVGQNVVLGPHVYVERGSSIGYGATIKNAIILANASVPSESHIDGAIVTSKKIIDV